MWLLKEYRLSYFDLEGYGRQPISIFERFK